MKSRIVQVGLVCSSLALGMLLIGMHQPTSSLKIASNLESQLKQRESIDSVLVLLKDQADFSDLSNNLDKIEKGKVVYERLTHLALQSQQPLVSWLDEQNLKFQRFYVQNMIAVQNISAEQIRELAERHDVQKIFGDKAFRSRLPQPLLHKDSSRGIETSLNETGATKVWQEFGVRGQGIVIAGQDTGVEWNHPALIRQYRGTQGNSVDHQFNWHDAIKTPIEGGSSCGYNVSVPCDDNDHGTHTVGTVVGDDGDNNKIGMAPEAKWIACRNMDAGAGRPSTYIECFEFLLAPYAFGGDPMRDGRPEMAPDVMNNSWGCPDSEGCSGGEMVTALQNLKSAGIMVVVSAGNDGPSCSTLGEPSHHSDLTLAVGAHNHNLGGIAYFSSRGPSLFDGGIGPDLTAPGVNIRSAIRKGRYTSLSGTSMAGPHVVGAVALLWSAQPHLKGMIDESIAMLTSTAHPTPGSTCGGVAGSATPNNTFGFGKLDIYAAVKKSLSM